LFGGGESLADFVDTISHDIVWWLCATERDVEKHSSQASWP